jgi:hypothetical protein
MVLSNGNRIMNVLAASMAAVLVALGFSVPYHSYLYIISGLVFVGILLLLRLCEAYVERRDRLNRARRKDYRETQSAERHRPHTASDKPGETIRKDLAAAKRQASEQNVPKLIEKLERLKADKTKI